MARNDNTAKATATVEPMGKMEAYALIKSMRLDVRGAEFQVYRGGDPEALRDLLVDIEAAAKALREAVEGQGVYMG